MTTNIMVAKQSWAWVTIESDVPLRDGDALKAAREVLDKDEHPRDPVWCVAQPFSHNKDMTYWTIAFIQKSRSTQ